MNVTGLRYLVLIFSLSILTQVWAIDKSDTYIDTPYFNILPNDPIYKAYNLFGESPIVKTPLAHDYILYYDHDKSVGLVFYIYQGDGTTIWRLDIRKEIRLRKLHQLAYMAIPMPSKIGVTKPISISLQKTLTTKGLKFGMTQKEIEAVLNKSLIIVNHKATLLWDKGDGKDIVDYGSVVLEFTDGGLSALSWSGVDP